MQAICGGHGLSVPQSKPWLDTHLGIRQMTFVLVGAGPTGVELAASMGTNGCRRCVAIFDASIRRKAPSSCSKAAIAFFRASLSPYPGRQSDGSKGSASRL
jgi:hypothetical protein